MHKQERQEALLSAILRRGYLSVEALAAELAVTGQTIRRDIAELSGQGLLRKVHGGAAPQAGGIAYGTRKVQAIEAKQRIAGSVAALVADGSALFLDTGTTCEAVAAALLMRRRLRIVTNNLHVAALLTARSDFELFVPGGAVRNPDGGVFGPAVLDFLARFRFDAAILGVSALAEEGMLMEYDDREVQVTQAALRQARRAVLAVDSSKFGRTALVCLGPLGDMDLLVTETEPPGWLRRLAEAGGTEVRVAG